MPGRGWGVSSPEERSRRSIYIHLKRTLLIPMLQQFDLADADSTCPVRMTTTLPTQALDMLNSEFLNEQARHFANRLRRDAGSGIENQVALALRLAFSREPDDHEIMRSVQLIEDLEKREGIDSKKSLEYFCLMTMNLSEFMYLD